jgi:hypothetical protein
MKSDEVRPLHIPVRLLQREPQVDGVDQTRIQQRDHRFARVVGQIVACLRHGLVLETP